MKALSIENINKSFGQTKVLRDFNLKIGAGQITALTGESGSGKSTILRLIAGLETLDSGTIKLDNKPIEQITPRKRKIGFVFQDLALFPHLTVKKNILFGYKGNNAQARLEELLHLTNLDGLINRYPHEISGGQQQRVALARALASSPELLLMDEPFSSLDERIKNRVRADILSIIKRLGITTIIVTHHASDAFAIADEVAILNEGKLLQFGSPSQIYKYPNNQYVAELFGAGIFIPVTINKNMVSSPFGSFKSEQKIVLTRGTLFIRPESVGIVQKDKGHIQGIIKQKAFKGPHDVLLIQDKQQQVYFELETERTSLNTSDRISLILNLNELIIFPD